MKKSVSILKLLLPIIVLFAILFPAIHSYEHIHGHTSAHKTYIKYDSNKSEFRLQGHNNEQCALCHFKISPAATFSFPIFSFLKCNTIDSFVAFYPKAYSNFFKGALFALRAPPSIK